MIVAAGTKVVEGIAIGRLRFFKPPVYEISEEKTGDPGSEVSRFEAAIAKVKEQQHALYEADGYSIFNPQTVKWFAGFYVSHRVCYNKRQKEEGAEVVNLSVVNAILTNRILITGIAGWAIAQLLKTIIYALVNRSLDLSRLTGDGGMPSSHSAIVTSVAVMTGFECGFDSAFFAIAAVIALVVMHDAMGVRLETGKQAQVINEMFELLDRLSEETLSMDVKLKEFVGHTPLQVAAGCILGIIVAYLGENYFG